jgi:hypothetical protein
MSINMKRWLTIRQLVASSLTGFDLECDLNRLAVEPDRLTLGGNGVECDLKKFFEINRFKNIFYLLTRANIKSRSARERGHPRPHLDAPPPHPPCITGTLQISGSKKGDLLYTY